MYRNILVPAVFDHEERGTAALRVARQLKASGGRIALLHVQDELPDFVEEHIPAGLARARGEEMRSRLQAMADTISDPVETEIVTGPSGRTILEFAATRDIDCIVIASHKPGLEDYFLGSTAARVVRHATCAVHVIR